MKTAYWRRGVWVGVRAALLVVCGAAPAVAEGRDNCSPREAPLQGVAAPAESAAPQPGSARSEFTVKYLKGKVGFGGKMDGVVVLADDSVCFRNRRGDRTFTIALESSQARVTTRQRRKIGCWVGIAALAPLMMFDPDQQCRKTEYLVEVEVAAPHGTERVVFKPTKAEAFELAAGINHRSARELPR